MISVFTPSHNTKYLNDCYESLLAQTYADWEWVVLLNGSANDITFEDKRVRVFRREDKIKGVGEAKMLACAQCRGDILVELDHDDRLVTQCLNSINVAFNEHPEIGFLYSNFIQLNEDLSVNLEKFNLAHGWEYKQLGYGLECCAFESHPHNNAYIWYAPNHVRAFRRDIYNKVGGYDPTLVVLDDQDLMCRMYLETEFLHLDECLYQQRIYNGNTQKQPELNTIIQSLTVNLYRKYIESMSLAWAKRKNLLAIDLGAAHRPKSGYISLDLNNAQITADVTKGLPFGDGAVGVIRAVDFLEHIPDKVWIINEIYRVLAPGGMLLSLTPSTDGRGAFSDPTHISFYNEASFHYYTRGSKRAFVLAIKAKFHESMLETTDTSWEYGPFMKHVTANLVAIKDQTRYAGLSYLV